MKSNAAFLKSIKAKGLKYTELPSESKDAIYRIMIRDNLTYWQARKIIMSKDSGK